MNAPKKLCCEGGCFRIIDGDTTRCPKHTEAHRTRRRGTDQRRPERTTDPFLSSAAWQKLRKAKLQANPLCECCEKAGRTTAAQQVHHKRARQDAPDLVLDANNLESVCFTCHRAYTVKATRERKQM